MPERVKRVDGRQLVRILERRGWKVDRIRGSHHIMRHADSPNVTLSVPVHRTKVLPVGTLLSILRDAGISADEFNEAV
jgi:predicted RNA binding protein YcfA (HicA-like mRNA interferase family)